MKTWLTLSLFVLLAGCDNGMLETGYMPRKLTDTPAVRQSYYASPFSPEAAQSPRGGESGMHAPGQY